MTQERLSGLAMISIENEILESINYEELINQFAITDFTAKLSGYDVTKLVQGRYTRVKDNDGGLMVFTEVLTGKQIANENEFQNIDDLLYQHEKMSLVHIAKSCFEMCNEVDSESKMLKVLEEYENYIPTCQNEAFTREAF